MGDATFTNPMHPEERVVSSTVAVRARRPGVRSIGGLGWRTWATQQRLSSATASDAHRTSWRAEARSAILPQAQRFAHFRRLAGYLLGVDRAFSTPSGIDCW